MITRLALVFVALAVCALASPKLRVSPIPLYLAAGAVLGPDGLALPGEEARGFLETAGELGVLLLLFGLGLEFSPARLLSSGKGLLTAGLVDLLVTWPLGFVLGAIVWGPGAGVFTGTMFYVSSSAVIVAFLISSNRLAEPETEAVLGILVFEDVVAGGLLVMAALVAGRSGGGVLVAEVALALVVGLVLGGLALRGSSLFEGLGRTLAGESFHLALLGALVTAGAAAAAGGLSAPLGALALGMALSEVHWKDRVEKAVRPLRDVLAAVFFFVVGGAITVHAVTDLWWIAAVAVLLATGGKVVVGLATGRPLRLNRRRSLVLGTTLVPRGEFGLVVATIAADGAALGGFPSQAEGLAGLLVLGTVLGGIPCAQWARRAKREVVRGAAGGGLGRSGPKEEERDA